MSVRFPYRRGLAVAAIATAGLIALTGCRSSGKDDDAAADRAPTTAATAQTPSTGASAKPTPSAGREAGGAKSPAAATKLPDVCGLLSKSEVSSLAGGRNVVQIDPDGATEGATTRYCQWQLSGARLAIFLSPTTAAEFTQAHGRSPAVSGVGDEAHLSSGHLFVRHGNVQIDVYSTVSDSNSAAERMAKSAAQKVVDRL
jgi:hypothetical protein